MINQPSLRSVYKKKEEIGLRAPLKTLRGHSFQSFFVDEAHRRRFTEVNQGGATKYM